MQVAHVLAVNLLLSKLKINMEMIENKVAKSGLITLDLQIFEPEKEIVPFDLKDFLFMDLILKEKDFRDDLTKVNWKSFEGKILAVFCSSDAIIAHWAYMLVVSHLSELEVEVHYGTPEMVRERRLHSSINKHNWSQYKSKRVLLKGCSNKELPPSVYLEATQKLTPFAERIMYGEACSFVPVYRAPKIK